MRSMEIRGEVKAGNPEVMCGAEYLYKSNYSVLNCLY